MKRFPLLLSCAVIGCGTTSSLEYQTIPRATVNMPSGLTVAGPILSESDSTITIAAYGVAQTYGKSAIVLRDSMPDPVKMQQEAVENSAQAASFSGILLGLTVLSLLTGVILAFGKF